MLAYFGKRFAQMFLTLLGVTVLVFFLLRVVPGDVVAMKLRGDGANVSDQTLALERARLGLDKSLVAQFGDWMVGVTKLDLGRSMWTDRPVVEEIAIRFQLTLEIAILATILGVLIAFPLGILSALTAGSWIDQIIRVITIGGIAIPGFWVGMLTLLALLAIFNWLPPITFTPIYVDPVANLTQLFWPALTVGYRLSAVVARLLRSSLLEILNEDYIRTARAKGVYERVVIIRHALRNALLPAVTIIGLEFAFLVGGLVVTEQVFNLNGVGKLFIDAVAHNDFTLIQGIVVMIAFFYIFVNFLVDLTYAALDPRVRVR